MTLAGEESPSLQPDVAPGLAGALHPSSATPSPRGTPPKTPGNDCLQLKMVLATLTIKL